MSGQSTLPGTRYRAEPDGLVVVITHAEYPIVWFQALGSDDVIRIASMGWQEFFNTFGEVR